MGEESSRTHEVFLSYSSKDKTWADAACAVLERHRLRCWIAPRDMTPGDEWGAGIIKGLNASRIMVLIFSDHANASKQVRKEVERAIDKELPVLAFRIQNVKPKDAMEFNLSNIHWLDAFTPPVEAQLELLAASVKKLLGRDAEPTEGTRATGGEPGRPQPIVAPTPWPPRMKRLIVLLCSLFGLMALVFVIITASVIGRKEAAGPRDQPSVSREAESPSARKPEGPPSDNVGRPRSCPCSTART